ncbi:hypothetical protein Asp14428_76470 [Actinoplanes sp. NBRC 14428]|uniref:Uncharacterized protein DUF1772 n=1 Tax=Pseudosporangium ferrugineum TaxID=439699 RepID=A0A2T0RX95_9ACTN|nr:DUF1772 domain-containing protein [Pseudosporangium ferrugineum]PRY25778.1 uncharacterized protein DUF1772 [Pseudosporangium ferrugineum]BCJ56172.1 hypothetical protein Asp14428_76470 [Actinoplanes sp. NBRC 14428]
MWSSVLTGVSLVGSGIQAGALLMVLYGVCPTFRRIPVPEWMRLHVALDSSIERYMPALNIVTGLTTLILLFLPQEPEVRALRIVALAHNIALAVVSEMVNVRINKDIAARVLVPAGGVPGPSLDELTEDETERLVAVRERWIRTHGWRTLIIVTGFVEYVIAVLLTT